MLSVFLVFRIADGTTYSHTYKTLRVPGSKDLVLWRPYCVKLGPFGLRERHDLPASEVQSGAQHQVEMFWGT